MSKIILDLCGGTGSWSKPYKEAGYDVRLVTLPDNDVLTYKPPDNVYGILAAPPCTMFSIARNDTTAKEPRDLRKGMELVRACLEVIWECRYEPIRKNENNLKFWALENPRGYLVDFLGQPYYKFHPYDFGDPYTKLTCLWGNFNIPIKNPTIPMRFGNGEGTFVKEVEHFAHLKEFQIPEGYQAKTGYTKRTIMRSITSSGFAKAFFEANQ
ncbi:MAG: hypothetical protein KAS32_04255 [Candidatus Peribacteraceae bacterium]|nr:hypothetical protein [Candidatus Peribacteraceae bacterium]